VSGSTLSIGFRKVPIIATLTRGAWITTRHSNRK